MASVAQITLIIACACVVDCRYMRRRLSKHRISFDDQHHIIRARTNLKDPDAVIFPNDDTEANIDASKKISEVIIGNDNELGVATTDNDESTVKYVPLPLISKMVPETDMKDVFTNFAFLDNADIIADKTTDDNKVKDAEANVVVDKIPTNDNPNAIIAEVEGSEIKLNDTVGNTNETVPDFSSRFGVSGSYVLVPVATNIQNYQPMQANSNIVPISSAQGNLVAQTHVPINQNANAINLQAVRMAPNVGANAQFVAANSMANFVPNVATNVQNVQRNTNTANVGANVYQASPNANVGSIQYAVPNNVNYNLANAPQGNSNTYVPVNVPSTYVINGQLYAAVTVPNNVNIPSSLYYVSPQVSYQVANNMPLYKLVSLKDGVSPQVVNTNTVGTYISKK